MIIAKISAVSQYYHFSSIIVAITISKAWTLSIAEFMPFPIDQ